MKRLIVAVLALACAACGGAGGSGGGIGLASAPAPLARTAIDEQAVTLAAKAVDAAALSAKALVKVGAVKPGTPLALKLAGALDLARDGVKAAEAARKAGNATSYAEALARATETVGRVRQIIAEIGG